MIIRINIKWNIIYDDSKYYERPYIIKYFLENDKNFGIEKLDDLKYLNLLK